MAFTHLDPGGPEYKSHLRHLREPDPRPRPSPKAEPMSTALAPAPTTVDLAPQLAAIAKMDDAPIAELAIDLLEQLEELDREHAARTATARILVDAATREIGTRLLQRQATAIAHPDLVIVLEPAKTKLDKRPEILQALFALLPAEDLVGAIWRDPPPEPDEMPLETNGTKLKKLAKAYGPDSEVGQVIARGMVTVPAGLPKLSITRRAKNVTQIEGSK